MFKWLLLIWTLKYYSICVCVFVLVIYRGSLFQVSICLSTPLSGSSAAAVMGLAVGYRVLWGINQLTGCHGGGWGSLHWCTGFLIKTSCTNCRVFERVIKLPLWTLQANLALPAGSRMSVYVQTNVHMRWVHVKNAPSGMLTRTHKPL